MATLRLDRAAHARQVRGQMLKSIDVLIGLSVIILALSMAVTVTTQALTTAFNSRGSHLWRGLRDLLRQLDPALDEETSGTLATALLTDPLSDPEATLMHVRTLALQLEATSPALSSAARQSMAMLHAGSSDFVAKVHSWFDQTMDRTAQRFTASTRAITFLGAFVVAFGLQVDNKWDIGPAFPWERLGL